MSAVRALVTLMLGLGAACGGATDAPLFPADYTTSFTQVRDCRLSADHDLNRVTVFTSPDAADAYTNRVAPFPVGAIVLKPQYDEADETCSGPILQWTVMQKLPAGSAPDLLDWDWQRVGSDRSDHTGDVKACAACHTGCGVAPDGYAGTCSVQAGSGSI